MRRSRTLGWDRNPLRRRTDRIEAAMVAALIGVFLICAPVLAVVASHWIGSATVPEQTIEAAWRLVPATGPPLRHSQVQAHTALAEWMAVLAWHFWSASPTARGESCSPTSALLTGPGHGV
jgi:hypothetical protein